MHDLWQEIIEDTRTLVRAAAGAKGSLTLSPEVAARFAAATPKTTPTPTPTEAQAPEPAIEVISEPSPPPVASKQPEQPAPPAAAVGEVPNYDHVPDLAALAELVKGCTRCSLCETRTQTVFGTGNPQADLVFVGEAPGFYEDKQGKPFVGKAGQLLTDIIEKGMKIRRDEVFICNVLKCRPPENRNPNPLEVAQCKPYLMQQLALIRPKVICALGAFSAHTLLETDEAVGSLRGRWHDFKGIPLRVTYHPAYLLRNEKDKAKTWEDIQEVMRRLAEA